MMDEWEKMMEPQELLPALVPFKRKGPVGPMIHHKLVIDLFYREGFAGLVNRSFEEKTKMLKKRFEEKNWGGYVFLHERPYRLEALTEIKNEMGLDFWELAADVWEDSENIWQYISVWKELWMRSTCTAGVAKKLMMSSEELAELNSLPEEVTIYRGGKNKSQIRNGMSWTLDEKKAEFFADRYKKNVGFVATAKVKKEKILAHFLGRNEKEVVIFPSDATNLKFRRIAQRDPKKEK